MSVEIKTYDPGDLNGFGTFAGIRLTEIGEDGDVLLLGHHDEAAAWAAVGAFNVDRGGDCEPHLSEHFDLITGYATFSDHMTECELVCCGCADESCDACKRNDHEACSDADCQCADEYEHEQDWSGTCQFCECYCDDYSWWVEESKVGHPVMWVRWSYAKARARAEEATRS